MWSVVGPVVVVLNSMLSSMVMVVDPGEEAFCWERRLWVALLLEEEEEEEEEYVFAVGV